MLLVGEALEAACSMTTHRSCVALISTWCVAVRESLLDRLQHSAVQLLRNETARSSIRRIDTSLNGEHRHWTPSGVA